jgi:uncharacterized protein YqjF (DUF2071 family)
MSDEILAHTEHRPWPVPRDPWIIFQSWRDLLFAHWRVSAHDLRPLVPAALHVDEFEGSGWLGVIPFRIEHFGPRLVPELPGLAEFHELNVRTYVRVDDKPGVYFFSLDAASSMAVFGARMFFGLPYFHADMSSRHDGGWIHYSSRREGDRAAEFVGRYRATGEEFVAAAGTLDYWLTERYCLYTAHGSGRPTRVDIHHLPWKLQRAEAVIDVNTMPPEGVELPDSASALHFARAQEVLTWAPRFAD